MTKRILLVVLALAAAPVVPAADLTLTAGRGTVIDYAADVGRVAASNPDVADAVAVSCREVVVNAKLPGAATIIIWSKDGARTTYNITVEQNIEPLQQLLKKTFPNYDVSVQVAKDSLSLTGVVPTKEDAERAAALLVPFGKAVANNLRIVPPGADKQVLLKVKFAELNRNASTSFGVNLLSTGALNTPGLTTTGQFGSPRVDSISSAVPGRPNGILDKFTIGDALNIFAFRPDLNLGAFIKALQNQGVLQILAEPNLVTTNGKEASFLVGGEFPIPVVQGGTNAGALTIMFKEFGIRLSFLPNITDHGTIRMYVKPEVSTIDLANAVLYSGFTIPALATRRMETSIELGQGQSFVIAGLIDERTTDSFSKVPGLAHIPVLGALFKSRDEKKTATELIVMVTPEITEAVNRSDVKELSPMPREFLPLKLFGPEGQGAQPTVPPKSGVPRK
jgi:pilus assembly protein CpaC